MPSLGVGLSKRTLSRILKPGTTFSEDSMNYRTRALSSFVGIAIVSFCIGQGIQAVKSQVALDVKMSDHDKIEKLLVEVAELQKKLAVLTQKYDTHTHLLRNLEVAQLPGSIECNQTVVQWAPTDIKSGSVDKVCRQFMSGGISVLVPGKESIVTAPPRP
jgi:hypothetical protein